jgi:hypothetical protein
MAWPTAAGRGLDFDAAHTMTRRPNGPSGESPRNPAAQRDEQMLVRDLGIPETESSLASKLIY